MWQIEKIKQEDEKTNKLQSEQPTEKKRASSAAAQVNEKKEEDGLLAIYNGWLIAISESIKLK